MRQKINLITLAVDDLGKALNFYETGLGWKKSSASQGDIAFFQLGGIVLGLYPRKLLAKDATVSDQGNEKDLELLKSSIKKHPGGPAIVTTAIITGTDRMYIGEEKQVAEVIAKWVADISIQKK